MPILLNELIQNYKSLMLDSTPPTLISRYLNEQADRSRSPGFEAVPRIGHQAPEVALPIPGAHGTEACPLSELCERGPILLKFYRGRWCPFCTLELKAYQKLMPALRDAGVRLIAITGESPEKIAQTRRHDLLSFDIVHDAGLNIASAFGLTYSLGPAEIELYQRHSCLAGSNRRSDPMMLALPALYLIGKNRMIEYASVSADTSVRAEPAHVLRFIQQNSLN